MIWRGVKNVIKPANDTKLFRIKKTKADWAILSPFEQWHIVIRSSPVKERKVTLLNILLAGGTHL